MQRVQQGVIMQKVLVFSICNKAGNESIPLVGQPYLYQSSGSFLTVRNGCIGSCPWNQGWMFFNLQ